MDNVNISPLFTNGSIQEKKEKAIAKENKELSTSLKNQEESSTSVERKLYAYNRKCSSSAS